MTGDLDERLLGYAVQVVKLVTVLPRNLSGVRIGDQLLRSGVSVGAHYQEAQAAESRNDFVHKLQVAFKELHESSYWLSLLGRAEITSSTPVSPLLEEALQLRAIFSKSVATARKNPR